MVHSVNPQNRSKSSAGVSQRAQTPESTSGMRGEPVPAPDGLGPAPRCLESYVGDGCPDFRYRFQEPGIRRARTQTRTAQLCMHSYAPHQCMS